MTESAPDNSPEAVYLRQQEVSFGLVEKLARKLVEEHGLHPLAVGNALLSYGSTLISTVDGKAGVAEFLEANAAALRELHEADEMPVRKRH